MKRKRNLLPLAIAAGIAACAGQPLAAQKQYEPKWDSLDTRPTPAWFQDAKFGIFIHWGVYSVPSWGPRGTYAEWYWNAMQNKSGDTWKFHAQTYGESFKYQDFAPKFKAELFDPNEWADIFARAGARYVVLTSKHHEGFCLWPSADSWNWNSVDVGPHRDLCGDLTTAVRAKGMKMGFYYSLYEWYNPTYKADFPRYVTEHFQPQFKDLVNRYHPSIIFADGEWEHNSAEWKSESLLAWLFNESPSKNDVVINDRWGKETRSHHGGYFTTEYGEVGGGEKLANTHPAEEDRGIGSSFGYNRHETLTDYQTSYGLVCLLANLVSRGSNLLLDVGPTGDGRIPVIMEQRLTDMGAWLKINGDAIYGTQPWKVHGEGPTPAAKNPNEERKQVFTAEDFRFTAKADSIYAICLTTPTGDVHIKSLGKSAGNLDKPIKKVTMLGSPEQLKWKHEGDSLHIQTPRQLPCSHAITFQISF